MLVLGLVFAVLAAVLDSLWGLAAGTARDWFATSPARLRRARRGRRPDDDRDGSRAGVQRPQGLTGAGASSGRCQTGAVAGVLEVDLDTVTTVLAARPAVLLAAALALVAVGWTALWRWTRTVVTIAHEGGHAVVAVLAGRGLTGIRLHADTSGLTVSTGARRWPGLVFTFLGGYPAPSLLGLGGALLVAAAGPG